jgi:hypothetical protein
LIKLSLSCGDAGAEFVPKEELPDRRHNKFNVSYIYLNKTLNYRTLFNPDQSRYLPPLHILCLILKKNEPQSSQEIRQGLFLYSNVSWKIYYINSDLGMPHATGSAC